MCDVKNNILILFLLQDFEESPFASFVYDAVWVFAYGLDKLFRKKIGALNTMHDKSTVE